VRPDGRVVLAADDLPLTVDDLGELLAWAGEHAPELGARPDERAGHRRQKCRGVWQSCGGGPAPTGGRGSRFSKTRIPDVDYGRRRSTY
jgi:hypothetical protein